MKLSSQRAERLALIAFLLHGLFFLLSLVIASNLGSTALQVAAWHFLGGSLIWLILCIQFRQRRLAEEEKRDVEHLERLRRQGKEASVFEGTAVDDTLHLAQRRLAWIEKYLVPIFAILFSAFLLGMGYWLHRWLGSPDVVALTDQRDALLAAAAYLSGFALVSFLFSRFAVGMSQEAEWRPLRAGGSYLLSNALVCFAVVISFLFADAGYIGVERILAYVVVFLMIAIGLEVILNLVLDAYRPRMKGQYHRAPYESRLLGLFSEPGGIFRTFAQAIDYQFGFKVSDTWFFKLLRRTVLPLVATMAIVLYLMSCLAIVPAGGVGVLERFGRPLNIAEPWAPGLHIKYPWPVDQVRVFAVENAQRLDIGFERFAHREDERPILWSIQHWAQELPFMVAVPGDHDHSLADPCLAVADEELVAEDMSPEVLATPFAGARNFDLLVVPLVIHYRIDDIAAYGYGRDRPAYQNPRRLLQAICYNEVIHVAARSDVQTLMGPGRYNTTQALRRVIQQRADELGLGITVTFAGLEAIHPPLEVAESFERVVSAFQQRQALVLSAQGRAAETRATQEGRAAVRLAEANAYSEHRRLIAEATAQRFRDQQTAYRAGGDVYLTREYLSVLDEYLPVMRKYLFISDAVDSWVYELDLKEQLQPDLFSELQLPEQENRQ